MVYKYRKICICMTGEYLFSQTMFPVNLLVFNSYNTIYLLYNYIICFLRLTEDAVKEMDFAVGLYSLISINNYDFS